MSSRSAPLWWPEPAASTPRAAEEPRRARERVLQNSDRRPGADTLQASRIGATVTPRGHRELPIACGRARRADRLPDVDWSSRASARTQRPSTTVSATRHERRRRSLLRRLPIGAECLRTAASISASGRRAPSASPWCSGPAATREKPLSPPRRADTSRDASAEAAEGTLYRFRLDDGGALSRSGLALSAGGPVRPVARRGSGGLRAGPTPAGPARRCASRSSTSCTWARSRAEGTWAAASAAARRARRSRGHVHRDDAGRRVPRPLRLGL